MMKKWSWFGAAAVMSAYALLNFGAPPIPVAIGIGLGALMTMRSTRSA
jgi:hypothetical protein